MSLKDVEWSLVHNEEIAGWSVMVGDRLLADVYYKEVADQMIEGHNLYLRAQEIVKEFLKDK